MKIKTRKSSIMDLNLILDGFGLLIIIWQVKRVFIPTPHFIFSFLRDCSVIVSDPQFNNFTTELLKPKIGY